MNAPTRGGRAGEIALAVGSAVLCHSLFAGAIGSLVFALLVGLQDGFGRLDGAAALAANLCLALQFPVLHSAALSRRGRRLLQRAAPGEAGRTLAPTTFAVFASLQLLAACWLWNPSGVVWHVPAGALGALQYALFAGSWLFLLRALYDAGMSLQSGAAGWWALLRGRPVDYGTMPVDGLFRYCRQPIYLGFALVLWTAPVWSLDWLVIASVWGAYCVAGPLLKEARWVSRYGTRFRDYRASVPYFVPRIPR